MKRPYYPGTILVLNKLTSELEKVKAKIGDDVVVYEDRGYSSVTINYGYTGLFFTIPVDYLSEIN